MPTPEEQALGVSGGSPAPVVSQRTILTAPQMEQFEREYYMMPSSELKHRYQTDPEFRAKVDAMNAPPQAAIEEAPITVPDSGTNDPSMGTAEPVAPAALPTPSQVPVEVVEESGDAEFYKQDDGRWVAVVDLEDGSGVQRFYGKTQKEAAKELIKAQKAATRKIRQQEVEKRELEAKRAEREKRSLDAELLLADPEVVPIQQFTPRQLTADEQWQLSQSLTDPSQLAKSLDKYFEARLGASLNDVAAKLNDAEMQKAVQRSVMIGKIWVAKNEDFYDSSENIRRIGAFMEEKKWDVTERNLDKAFAYMRAKGLLEDAPEDFEETVTPTAAQPEIPAAAAPAVTPAPVAPAAPAANKPVPTVNVPAIPGTTILGIRPGSASTGLSPRDSSVRQENVGVRPAELTAEEYRNTPMSIVKRRYATDPAYKAALDKLFAEGKA